MCRCTLPSPGLTTQCASLKSKFILQNLRLRSKRKTPRISDIEQRFTCDLKSRHCYLWVCFFFYFARIGYVYWNWTGKIHGRGAISESRQSCFCRRPLLKLLWKLELGFIVFRLKTMWIVNIKKITLITANFSFYFLFSWQEKRQTRQQYMKPVLPPPAGTVQRHRDNTILETLKIQRP